VDASNESDQQSGNTVSYNVGIQSNGRLNIRRGNTPLFFILIHLGAKTKIKKLPEIIEQLSDYIHTISSCANIDRKQFIPKKILSFFESPDPRKLLRKQGFF
jgi:hypothetical protein